MNASKSYPGGDRVPAILFDLDGTLVDSVYQHVLAWREALERSGTRLSVWRIHRRIGMSGGLLVNALLRETGHEITPADAAHLQKWHAEAYSKLVSQVRPLPGAVEILAVLAKAKVPYAIATSGMLESARPSLKALHLGSRVPVITRDQVKHASPIPICSWPPRSDWVFQFLIALWSGTASGTFWLHVAPEPWAWAWLRAATARTN